MNAMKSPIPIAIAFFKSSGIASMIRSRIPVRTRIVTAILHDDEPHRGREGQPLACDETEGDDRVQPQAGRDRVRLVRVQAHDDRHHAGDEARGRENLVEGQADLGEAFDPGEAEDLRVDEDDVGHDDEGRHAGHRVAAEGRPVPAELEVAIEEAAAGGAAGSDMASPLPSRLSLRG